MVFWAQVATREYIRAEGDFHKEMHSRKNQWGRDKIRRTEWENEELQGHKALHPHHLKVSPRGLHVQACACCLPDQWSPIFNSLLKPVLVVHYDGIVKSHLQCHVQGKVPVADHNSRIKSHFPFRAHACAFCLPLPQDKVPFSVACSCMRLLPTITARSHPHFYPRARRWPRQQCEIRNMLACAYRWSGQHQKIAFSSQMPVILKRGGTHLRMNILCECVRVQSKNDTSHGPSWGSCIIPDS